MAKGIELTAEEIVLLRFGLWKERRHRMDIEVECSILDRLDMRLLDYLNDVVRRGTAHPDS